MATTNLGKVSLTPKGVYCPHSAYEALDIVTYGGSSYLVKKDVQGVTPTEGEFYMLLAERGASGCFPRLSVPYGEAVTVIPNTQTDIGTLTGDIEISLGDGDGIYASEWCFTLSLEQTAHDITLPEVRWVCGIAPVFAPDSTTEVRLWYKGDTLEGMWL